MSTAKTARELYLEYRAAPDEDKPAAQNAWADAERAQAATEREEIRIHSNGEAQR